jgi:hypothetical protein
MSPQRSTSAPARRRARPGTAATARRRAPVRGPRASRAATFSFTATIAERGPTGLWPHLFLPPAASAWLGRRGAVPVIMTAEGLPFARTARPDGAGGHFLLFNADMRERTGAEVGDRVRVSLEVDPAPRGVEPPRDLVQALKDAPRARAAFAAMPPSHRRSYIAFIEDAKRAETRVRRVQQALRMIEQWGEDRAPAPSRAARR